MKDVTDLMSAYRECARHLWNVYFAAKGDSCEPEQAFEQIRRLLFDALVVTEAGIDDVALNQRRNNFRVVPRGSVPILIRRPSRDGNWYWDQEPNLRVGPTEVQLLFADYYDYGHYPLRDFQFYLCHILAFPSRSEYQGRDALIEVGHAEVFYWGDAGRSPNGEQER